MKSRIPLLLAFLTLFLFGVNQQAGFAGTDSDITELFSDDIFGYYEEWPPDEITDDEVALLKELVCVLETTKGEIRIQLFPTEAPLHSANFVKLIQEEYYDGLTFHRVIEGFMSQGGCPLGTGTGGPGYTIPAEIELPHDAGSLAAARTGDQVNPERESSGSQFYLCHSREGTSRLDGMYTVYGEIIEGQDVNLSLNITYNSSARLDDVKPDRIVKAWVEIMDREDYVYF